MKSLFPGFDHHQPVDPCASRHGGAETSREAFERARLTLTEDRQAAYEFVCQAGAHGATAKEFAAHAGKSLNAVSGRFSELRHAGLVRDCGRRREGCAVLVVEPKRGVE